MSTEREDESPLVRIDIHVAGGAPISRSFAGEEPIRIGYQEGCDVLIPSPGEPPPWFAELRYRRDQWVIETNTNCLGDSEKSARLRSSPGSGREAAGEPFRFKLGGAHIAVRTGMGFKLDRYLLRARLGEGGMGLVYLANQLELGGRDVVVKIYKREAYDDLTDDEIARRSYAEARFTAHSQHQNVVTVYGIGSVGTWPYIVMEYLPGKNLAEIQAQLANLRQRCSPRTAVAIISPILRGLHAAHEAEDSKGRKLAVVHRDMSPTNVVLVPGGPFKLIDFGVARAGLEGISQGSYFAGKVRYSAPEQWTNPRAVDRRADLYSTAIILYELLAGQALYGQQSLMEIRDAVCNQPVRPIEQVPAPLWQICQRALQRDPSQRFATAREFAEALDSFLLQGGGAWISPEAVSAELSRLGVCLDPPQPRLLTQRPYFLLPSVPAVRAAPSRPPAARARPASAVSPAVPSATRPIGPSPPPRPPATPQTASVSPPRPPAPASVIGPAPEPVPTVPPWVAGAGEGPERRSKSDSSPRPTPTPVASAGGAAREPSRPPPPPPAAAEVGRQVSFLGRAIRLGSEIPGGQKGMKFAHACFTGSYVERAAGKVEPELRVHIVGSGGLRQPLGESEHARLLRRIAELRNAMPQVAPFGDSLWGARHDAGSPTMVVIEGAPSSLSWRQICTAAGGAGLDRSVLIAALAQVVQALRLIDSGIPHGELSPSSIFVVPTAPSGPRVWLALPWDLRPWLETGAARLPPPSCAEYLAPECLDGSAPTASADVYAAAGLILDLLGGSLPLWRKSEGQAGWPSLDTLPAGVPSEILATLAAALHRDPGRRPRADEFARLLQRVGTEPTALGHKKLNLADDGLGLSLRQADGRELRVTSTQLEAHERVVQLCLGPEADPLARLSLIPFESNIAVEPAAGGTRSPGLRVYSSPDTEGWRRLLLSRGEGHFFVGRRSTPEGLLRIDYSMPSESPRDSLSLSPLGLSLELPRASHCLALWARDLTTGATHVGVVHLPMSWRIL